MMCFDNILIFSLVCLYLCKSLWVYNYMVYGYYKKIVNLIDSILHYIGENIVI